MTPADDARDWLAEAMADRKERAAYWRRYRRAQRRGSQPVSLERPTADEIARSPRSQEW